MYYEEVHSSPDRLDRPLLRKGSGWVEISYEDALEVLASNFERCKDNYGAESVAFLKGESLKHQELTEYFRHLAYGFGTPNYMSVGSLCHASMVLGHELTIGGMPMPDFKNLKLAIVWGANPAMSDPRMFHALRGISNNGTKLLVVDPARTQTAKIATVHLPITPGSDGFLALAFIKYAIEKGCIKHQMPLSNGWNELKYLVSDLTYEYLLEKAGIRKADFYKASSLIFENLPGWILTGLGLELQPCGIQSIRAIASLQSILGHLPSPEPVSFELKPLPGQELYPPMAQPVGAKEVPIFTRDCKEGQGMYLTRAILYDDPYPVRAMLVAGCNPILTFPDPKTLTKAFQRLDFLAVFDLFMTPTAQLANLILPAADFLEYLELHDYGLGGSPFLGLVQPVTTSQKGWPAWKLIFELARKLGLEKLFPWSDNRHALVYRLSGNGVHLDHLENSPSSTVVYGAKKASDDAGPPSKGKVHYYSKEIEATGNPGLPTLDALTLPFSTDERFPFWLSTGDKVSSFQHSQFRKNQKYRQQIPEPLLDIHPDAAGKVGIRSRDYVMLSTRYGQIHVRANLNDDLRADCLRMAHGWEEANVNELAGLEHFDPISGFPWLRALPARVDTRELTPENLASEQTGSVALVQEAISDLPKEG